MGTTRRAHRTQKRRLGNRRPGEEASRYFKSQSDLNSDRPNSKVQRSSRGSQPNGRSESQPSRAWSEEPSDIAAEIIVWTDDMDLDDDGASQGEVEEEDITEIKVEDPLDLDQPASRIMDDQPVTSAIAGHTKPANEAIGSFTPSLTALSDDSDLSSAPPSSSNKTRYHRIVDDSPIISVIPAHTKLANEMIESFASSLSALSEDSDLSSAPPSSSSKATTPLDFDGPSGETVAGADLMDQDRIPDQLPGSEESDVPAKTEELNEPGEQARPEMQPAHENFTSEASNFPLTTHEIDDQPEESYLELEAPETSITSSIINEMETHPLSAIPGYLPTTPTTPSRSSLDPFIEEKRRKFTVKPRSSIPPDLSNYEYARECIESAESCRLNPYALHQEEYHLLRDHISYTQVTTYLNIRNGILRTWIKNPRIAVTREEAVGCASARWFDVASLSYDWLVRRGFINFGCTAIPVTEDTPAPAPPKPKRKTVVVIGAGMSGLGCARQLDGLFTQYASHFKDMDEEPPRVVVLEGRRRIGGRVYSRPVHSKLAKAETNFAGQRHTVEMGGMIITGFFGNPMNILVRGQLGLPYHALRPETTIFDHDGQPVDLGRDQRAEKLYNECLDRASDFKFKLSPPKRVEGNRDLINGARDGISDSARTMRQVEDGPIAGSASPFPVQRPIDVVLPNAHPVVSSAPANLPINPSGGATDLTAAQKAKAMGWTLRDGVVDEQNIDLEAPAASPSATLGSVLDSALMQYKDLVEMDPQDFRLINWHIANLEYSNATNLHNLSLGGWDIDAGNEWEGKHTMIVGGYQSVPRGLLLCPHRLDLHTEAPVRKIRYNSQNDYSGPAVITCEDGTTYDADYVVSTIPLGVLKHGDVEFDPPLPTWKSDAIARLGFGILNKVMLVFKEPFWEADRHIFGALRMPEDCDSVEQSGYSASRGRFFQWFNVSTTTGLPCLLALMAGDAGFSTESSTNDELVTEALSVLRSIFQSKHVPDPVKSVVTRWGADRFAYGSYSSSGPDMQLDDYDSLAKPIGNLFFAGEHTIGTHPATVHGAYMSGLRAAGEVLDSLIGPITVPTPLIRPRESNFLKRKEPHGPKDARAAQIEQYENRVHEHICTKIGERPLPPLKVAASGYTLYSKANFELARAKCAETRRQGRGKPGPNEVRLMTSKLWKQLTPEEKQPFEEKAAEVKKSFAAAQASFLEAAEKWDLEAANLKAQYGKEHPLILKDHNGKQTMLVFGSQQRRKRLVSYAEDDNSDANK